MWSSQVALILDSLLHGLCSMGQQPTIIIIRLDRDPQISSSPIFYLDKIQIVKIVVPVYRLTQNLNKIRRSNVIAHANALVIFSIMTGASIQRSICLIISRIAILQLFIETKFEYFIRLFKKLCKMGIKILIHMSLKVNTCIRTLVFVVMQNNFIKVSNRGLRNESLQLEPRIQRYNHSILRRQMW